MTSLLSPPDHANRAMSFAMPRSSRGTIGAPRSAKDIADLTDARTLAHGVDDKGHEVYAGIRPCRRQFLGAGTQRIERVLRRSVVTRGTDGTQPLDLPSFERRVVR